jgi:sulfonate transport system permease protein
MSVLTTNGDGRGATPPAPGAGAAGPGSGPQDAATPPARTTIRRAPRANALRAQDVALRASVPLVLVGLWAFGSATGAIDPKVFPAPWEVWDAFVELVTSGVLWENLSVSLVRMGIGFAIGGTLGIVLGIAAGLFRLGDQLLDPTLQMLRTIPFLAIAPLLILWFGIDERPKVTIIAAAALFPLYLNTHSGVRGVDRKILEAGRVFGLRGVALVRHVILPESIPSILVGLRVSLSVSLLALIVAELTNAPLGLGALMTSAQQYFQTDVLVVIVLIYALWGLAVDLVVRGIERVLLPYKRYGRRA